MTAVFFKPLLFSLLQVTLFVIGVYSIAASDSYVRAVKGCCGDVTTAVQFTTDLPRIFTIVFITAVTSLLARNSLLTFLCLVQRRPEFLSDAFNIIKNLSFMSLNSECYESQFVPVFAMKTCRGRVKGWLRSFLFSALGGGELSALRLGR
jgi:uncharacterized membrane protein